MASVTLVQDRNGMACCLGHLVHVGVNRAPNKSTLSYADEHRPAAP